ncbi:hypothetical protein ACOME3_006363 [Neoechinorhynchus agilis]
MGLFALVVLITTCWLTSLCQWNHPDKIYVNTHPRRLLLHQEVPKLETYKQSKIYIEPSSVVSMDENTDRSFYYYDYPAPFKYYSRKSRILAKKGSYLIG